MVQNGLQVIGFARHRAVHRAVRYSSSHVIRWAPHKSQAYGMVSSTCHPAATLLLADIGAEVTDRDYLACRITGKYQNKCKPFKRWFRVEVYASEVII